MSIHYIVLSHALSSPPAHNPASLGFDSTQPTPTSDATLSSLRPGAAPTTRRPPAHNPWLTQDDARAGSW